MAIAALDKMGLDPHALMAQAQISQIQLMNPIGRVPVIKELYFWKLAAEKSANPQIALRMAEHVPFGTFPLLEYIGASSQSLYQALVFFNKYAGFIYGGWRPSLSEDSAGIRFELGTEGDPEEFRYTNEFGFAVMVKRFKHFSERDLPVHSVHFRHSLMGDPEEYKKVFGDTVKFDQEEDSILFDAAIKEIPCKRSDHFMLSSLLNLAEKFLHQLDSKSDGTQNELIGKIKSAISKHLPLGEPQADSIAKTVAMSTRTLQRKLEAQGTSLNRLVTQVRKEMASKLLKDRNLSYEEIALTLGYSTLSAFNRAFKQWFKMSPSEFRKSHYS